VPLSALLCVLTVGCRRSEPPPDPGQSPAPVESLRVMRGLPSSSKTGGAPLPTDGREKEQGKRFHPQVKAQCADERDCIFRKCAELCSHWVRETYAPNELTRSRLLNQLYFSCTGFCVDPNSGD
jgi:hypothetical protein